MSQSVHVYKPVLTIFCPLFVRIFKKIDKRNIFLSQGDFQRFYESLHLFNDKNYRRGKGDLLTRTCLLAGHAVLEDEREPFVKIVAFCLMSNHFHLLLQQEVKDGISKFMHRVGMGYSKYFNEKHDRSGSLYEGAFKAVEIKKDNHFKHLPRYIHLNALDNTSMNWREGVISDWGKADSYLDSYEWSSHHVYKGRNQMLPIVDLKIQNELHPSVDDYEHYLQSWSGRTCMPFAHLYKSL